MVEMINNDNLQKTVYFELEKYILLMDVQFV